MSVKTGAGFKRHVSRQDIATPREFIKAVELRFGPIGLDLAAETHNKVTEDYIGPGSVLGEDSLEQPWGEFTRTNLWCNPEFEHIGLYAEKAASECRERSNWMFLLGPASVDSNWFNSHVLNKAFVMPLAPRITFVGQDEPYPKGLFLAAYGFGVYGWAPWRWRESRRRIAKIIAATAAE